MWTKLRIERARFKMLTNLVKEVIAVAVFQFALTLVLFKQVDKVKDLLKIN
jgi:hypothetical protein